MKANIDLSYIDDNLEEERQKLLKKLEKYIVE